MKGILRRLGSDPLMLAGLLASSLAIAAQTVPARSILGAWIEPLLDALVVGLGIAALLWARSRVEGNERRFWGLLASAWSCLLLVDFFFLFELPLPVVGTPFATDLLHLLFYLGFVLAIDFRPHLPQTHTPSAARRQLESVAGVTVVFGLLIYFSLVVLPEPIGLSLSFVARDQGLAPFLFVRVSLNLLILGRLIWAWVGSGGRWRWIYGLLGGAAAAMTLKDALFLAQVQGVTAVESAAGAFGVFLYLPTLLALTAARFRHFAMSDLRISSAPTVTPRRENYQASRLVLYALLVPALHFLLYTIGILEPEARAPREAFCLAYMLVLGAMAWFHQGMIASDAERARQALRGAQERLNRSERLESIGRLAGGIAHDFNNYLTVIQGYGELVEGNLPQDAKKDFAFIRGAAEQAGKLTSQLLAFGGRQLARPGALDLNETIVAMGRMLERLLGEDIEIRFDLDPGVGMVAADQGQIEQIFVNLALNSRDAMPDGGTLAVSTQPVAIDHDDERVQGLVPGAYAELLVADTGIGMTESVRSKIFEPFFTTKSLGQGTGLGLSTVYGIVTQAGGMIDIDSIVDQGTTVRVLLPCAEPEAKAEADLETPIASPTPIGEDSATILLVEDEEAVRTLAERALSDHGFEVLVADSGRSALDLADAQTSTIDMLVTDVMMPEMDGIELATRLEARMPGLPVLFMSGYPLETLRARHGKIPTQFPLLHKPFSASAFVEAVRRLVRPK